MKKPQYRWDTKISRYLDVYSDKLIIGVRGVILLALGLFMWISTGRFESLVITLLLSALYLLTFLHILGAAVSFLRDKTHFFPRLADALLTGLFALFLSFPLGHVLILLPIAFAIWAMILAVIHFISFWLNRKEKHTEPLVHLLHCVLCLSFSLYFFCHLPASQTTSLKMLGIYITCYGGFTLLDLLCSFTPQSVRNQIKTHIHIPLPVFLASFIPSKVLTGINRYFAKEGVTSLNVKRSEQAQPNVEIFIHVADHSLIAAMGHADLWVDGVYYSYGCYDESQMKLGGGLGPGTLFTHREKEAYIRLCQDSGGKALFGFGLLLNEAQLAALKKKLAKIMEPTYVWKPDAQLAAEGSIPQKDFPDYASKVYLATHASFYKFSKGSFKHYFVMGTNCVKLIDTLLRAADVDSVPSGIVAPGSYYDILNQEFMREGSCVVSRNVYLSEENIEKGMKRIREEEKKVQSGKQKQD